MLREGTSVLCVGASARAVTEVKQETKVAKSLPPKRLWLGGAIAIKGDGNCCYHLAGVLAKLCRNPNALSHGAARCLGTDIRRARDQILQHFRNWLSENSELSHEQLGRLYQEL